MRRIYVASSWRNLEQLAVVSVLRRAGHEVYDFRNPRQGGPPGAPDSGFGWSSIDPAWQRWSPCEFVAALDHPVAQRGFVADWNAMRWADTFVLVMPCGRSAHLEAGWAVGAAKPTAILLADGEPELMYKMAEFLAVNTGELLGWLASLPASEVLCPSEEHGP